MCHYLQYLHFSSINKPNIEQDLDNIKLDLKKILCRLGSFGSYWGAVVNTQLNFRIPKRQVSC